MGRSLTAGPWTKTARLGGKVRQGRATRRRPTSDSRAAGPWVIARPHHSRCEEPQTVLSQPLDLYGGSSTTRGPLSLLGPCLLCSRRDNVDVVDPSETRECESCSPGAGTSSAGPLESRRSGLLQGERTITLGDRVLDRQGPQQENTGSERIGLNR